MWLRRRRRILRGLALGFAVLAVAAPAAQGRIEPAQGRIAEEPLLGDQRQALTIVLGKGFASEYLQPERTPVNAVVPSEPTGGFDWRDAGIGIAFAFGLIALAAAGALARKGGRLARA